MNIPTWVVVVGCISLHLMVGLIQAIVMTYKAGRRGRGGLDGIEALGLSIAWPVCNVILAVVWVVDKFDDFMSAVRKRGEESVMPPENECQGHRIDR